MKLKNLFTMLILLFIPLLWGCSSDSSMPGEQSSYPPPVAVDTLLDNGLHIRDTELGSGAPVDSGYYFRAHYIGYLQNGEIFDSSYERNTPIHFQLGVGQVIPAWEQGIKGMRAGGKRVLETPAELAYGQTGIPGIIPSGQSLRFDIEMLEVIVPPSPLDLGSGRMQRSSSGIEYMVHRTGNGRKPDTGDMVNVHYSGYLSDGTLFDSSHLRSESFRFRAGTGYVISGWDQMILDMRAGEIRTIIVPADHAYGDAGIPGVIPPNAELRFDIELLEITK